MNPHLQKFIILHQQLQKIINETDIDEELLQQKIMKYIAIMAEQGKQTEFRQHTFDYFCEHNGVNILASLLKLHSIIAIKAYSLLFINLKDDIWISYILCQPFVMEAIQTRCDAFEQEWTEYYISFLKSLSIRINETQISVFYNKKSCTFPIVFEAMKYFNHPDFMVRTSVMNIILQLMKINEPKVVEYFSRFPFTSYLITFSCEVYELIRKFNAKLVEPEEYEKINVKSFGNYHVDLSDYLYYFNDLIKFGTSKGIQIIRNAFFAYITVPLFQMLMSKNIMEVKHAILLISQCLKIIKDKNIVETIVLMILSPKISKKLINKIQIQQKVYFPLVYQQQFQPNQFYWNKYRNDITGHCLEVFQDVLQFGVQYEELNHQTTPEFVQEVGRISNFISYDLLQNKKTGEDYLQLLINPTEGDALMDNPYKQFLLKILEKQETEELYILVLGLFIKIIQNKVCSKMTLMVCEIQRFAIDLKYVQECGIILSPLQNKIKQILLQRLINFNFKQSKIGHIEITIRMLKMLTDQPFNETQQEKLYHKYKQIAHSLMTFVIKQHIIDLVQHFTSKHNKVQENLSSDQLLFQVPFAIALLPQNRWQQKNSELMVPTTLGATIGYHIHQFWLYRYYVKHYFQHFYDAEYADLRQQSQKYFDQKHWKLGHRYRIKQKKTVSCDMVRKQQKKPKRVTIIQDGQIFVIAEPESEGNQYKIIVHTSWINITFEMNRDECTTLDATVIQGNQRDNFSLIFDDQVRSSKVLANFNDMKWSRCEKELSFIHKFLDNIIHNE